MKQKLEFSLKSKTLVIVGALVLPLLILLIVFCVYTVNQSFEFMRKTGNSTLLLYQNSLENDLRSIESMMISLAASDQNYQELGHSMEPYDKYGRLYNVCNRYKDIEATYPIIGAMHLYASSNDVSHTEYAGSYSYQFKRTLQSTIQFLVKSEPNPSRYGWFYQDIEGSKMLLRFFGSDNLFTVCMVDPQNLNAPQNLKREDDNENTGILLYATPEGEMVLDDLPIEVKKESGGFVQTGGQEKYVVSSQFSQYSGSWLIYLQPGGNVFGSLDLFQSFLVVLSVVLCLLVPITVNLLNRSSFIPMAHLMETVQQIKEGGAELRMEKRYSAKEFRILNATFHELLEQIRKLKIESYEKEIQEQKTQLLLLQSQIRPHFYLNCLKNIQALAQRGHCDAIQELVLNLSAYLRHLFQSGSSMVPLWKELESIQNYISLQRLTSSQEPECVFCVPDELMSYKIPPLSLLTFVENSVKHGQIPERKLSIHIKAMLLKTDEGGYLNLTVTDNGKGFPKEILKKLSMGEQLDVSGHVGINNVLKRLEVIYQKKESCSFFNLQEGSCIDLSFPLETPEDKDSEKE